MKQAWFDIDTQIDFMFPGGALYVPGAEKIIPVIARLNQYANEHGIPLISTVCAHTEDDPEFRIWGPHCVVGTPGFAKPAATIVGQRILPKQQLDMFTSPAVPGLLQEFAADEYVVYGVVTEVCVKLAADGLLRTGRPVAIVADAVIAFNQAAGDEYLGSLTARGGRITSSSDLTGQRV